jgi:glycosyltransferase involved in cell wall biosynthesis
MTQIVFIDDNLNELEKKGSIVKGYYNLSRIFDKVVFVTLSSPKIDESILRYLSNDVEVEQINFTFNRFYSIISLLHRPLLIRILFHYRLKSLYITDVKLVRSYGSRIASYLASIYSCHYGLPHIISLHENLKSDYMFRLNPHILRYIYTKSFGSIAKISLKNAKYIIISYRSISKYLEKINIYTYSLIYNLVQNENDIEKSTIFNDQRKILWIGRMIPEKSPINIVKAISMIPEVKLTIVGNGKLRPAVEKLVRELDLVSRVSFINRIDNNSIVRFISGFDLFVANVKVVGIPRTVIESFFAKTPVIINENIYGDIPEYSDRIITTVHDSIEGYYSGIKSYILNTGLFEAKAKEAFNFAFASFDPNQQIQKYNDLIKSVISINS